MVNPHRIIEVQFLLQKGDYVLTRFERNLKTVVEDSFM